MKSGAPHARRRPTLEMPPPSRRVGTRFAAVTLVATTLGAAGVGILFGSLASSLGVGIATAILAFPYCLWPLTTSWTNGVASLLTRTRNSLSLADPVVLSDERYATCLLYPMRVDRPTDVDVVVQTMRTNVVAMAGMVHIYHVALVDFPDASSQSTDMDDVLRETTEAEISKLQCEHPDAFIACLFRRRTWSKTQRGWIAWERKRGKIMEFCTPTAQLPDTTFLLDTALARAAVEARRASRFALVVDAGSELSSESASILIRAAAHPANRATLDGDSCRVIKGFTFFRPSMCSHPATTLFARIAFGAGGEVEGDSLFQHLTGYENFYGQGLLDMASAHAILKDHVPEDSVLSHDLLEGALAGAVKVDAASLKEGTPSRYSAFYIRQHRWARGDFQLAPWFFGRRARLLNPIHRWLLFNNCVSQFNSFSLVGLLCMSWFTLPARYVVPASVLIVGAYYLSAFVLDPMFRVARAVKEGRRRRVNLRAELWQTIEAVIIEMIWIFFALDHALLALDAAARVAWRRLVGQRLLQWTPDDRSRDVVRLRAVPSRTWLSAGVASLVGVMLALLRPASLPAALPFLSVWLALPVVIVALDRPLRHTAAEGP